MVWLVSDLYSMNSVLQHSARSMLSRFPYLSSILMKAVQASCRSAFCCKAASNPQTPNFGVPVQVYG